MKIALTGATGHIGVNLAKAFSEKGWQVRAVVRNPEKAKVLQQWNIEIVCADVLDSPALQKAFSGMDAVVHCAAKISISGNLDGSVMKTNVQGTANVVEACLQNNIRRLVHFSSIHAFRYDRNTPVVDENLPLADDRSFAYDHSKALGTSEVLKGVARGLDAVVVHPTSVLGPHDYFHSFAGDFLNDLFRGKLPALVAGGFDWVDVRDIVAATAALLEMPSLPHRQYLLSGHWAAVNELAKTCAEVSGKRPPLLVLPTWTAILGLPFLKAWSYISGAPPLYTYESLMILKHGNPNSSHRRAAADFDYSPRPLEDTIRDTFEWWKGQSLP